MDTDQDLWAQRTARARAAIHQPLKKGHAWSEQFYAYDYQEDGMLFLHWFDDSPKKNIATRLSEAVAAYVARFGERPNVILVSEHDAGRVSMAAKCGRRSGLGKTTIRWDG